MKRLVVLALVTGSLLYAGSVYAVDINFEGDFRVRGIYSDNLSDANDNGVPDDQQAFADGRFRLKTTFTAGLTSAVLIVDFTNSFSDRNNNFCPPAPDPKSSPFCGTGNFRFGTSSFGGSYNIAGVRSAYLKFNFDLLKVVLGRKQFMLGHGLILDDAIDSVAGRFMLGSATVTLVDGKLFDSNNGTTSGFNGRTGSDTNLYILDVGMNHGEEHALGLFVTYLNDRDHQLVAPGLGLGLPGAIAGDTTLLTIGLTADGSIGPINGVFEIDFLTGSIEAPGTTLLDSDLEGFNLLVGAGMPVGPANIDIAFLFTTGEDSDPDTNVNGISGNFVLGNILINDDINSDRDGQCASVPSTLVPGGGRVGSGSPGCTGGLGVTAIKLTAGLPGFVTENGHTELAVIYAETTEDPIDPVSFAAGDNDLGFEIDLNHNQKLDDNLSVSVNLGWLIAGDAWRALGDTVDFGPPFAPTPTGSDDDQLKGILSVNYMF